jgi:hypothetical protein
MVDVKLVSFALYVLHDETLGDYKWFCIFWENLRVRQQDKWNGSFSVKWHIVKDNPNSILKHTILGIRESWEQACHDSCDTQEVSIVRSPDFFNKFTSLKKCGVFFVSFFFFVNYSDVP